jgi:hypothetical protein
MLINSVTINRIGSNIDKIVTSHGKFKGTEFVIEQFFKRGKQVERHIQVIKPNFIRNNVKVRNVDGKFSTWG